MNQATIILRTEFGPEIQFALRPAPAAPFRASQETEFDRLKNRLLAEALAGITRPELNAPVRRAANEAAALAWVTFLPLLVFPELFAEKASKALRQPGRLPHIRSHMHTRKLVCA